MPQLLYGSCEDKVYFGSINGCLILMTTAVFVCNRFPLDMFAFQNAGTLIISEDLLPLFPSFTSNVIIIRIEHLEDVEKCWKGSWDEKRQIKKVSDKKYLALFYL